MEYHTTMINSKKKNVLFRGPVLTQSGYGVHARQVAKWLLSREDITVEFQALPWGDTPWLIDSEIDNGFIGKIMEKTVDPAGKKYDATVQLQLPNEWDISFSNVNIGITAGVETDKCNPEWVKSCNKMSKIIVPSTHSKNCLMVTDRMTVDVAVIPEAYCEAVTKNEKTKIDDLDFSTNFNVLLFGQITGNNPENDRKNIFYTIKWLCESFKNDKDFGVVIKTNTGRNTNLDKKIVTQTLQGVLREVRKGDFPKVYLLHGDMSDAEVASLYKHPKIKALVALTRGEGYGLPILEAAASGLPVIATSWSGHTDFLSHGKYIEIPYVLNPVHQSRIDGKIFMPGSRWAQPLEDEFKKKITKFKDSSAIPKEWAQNLKQKIIENYSIESIMKLYNEYTSDLL